MAADVGLLPGAAGLVRSARANTAAELRFHLITPASDEALARQTLRCLRVEGVQFYPLSESWMNATLLPRIRVVADPAITGHLDSPLNFARFFLTSLLPPHLVASRARVLYLDADIIVHGDLQDLLSQMVTKRFAVAAVPRHEAHFRYSRYAKKCETVYMARYPGRPAFDASQETFNAGVVLIDLGEWQNQRLTEEAVWWMERHVSDPNGGLWHLGSQPIMHLMLHGIWQALPDNWNLDGLGRLGHLPPKLLREAKLLHWTGRKKPWLLGGLHVEQYRRYVPDVVLRHCNRVIIRT